MSTEEFTYDSGAEITKLISGKVVDCIESPDEVSIDDYLIIRFKDGESLHIRYDYLYEWELKHGSKGR